MRNRNLLLALTGGLALVCAVALGANSKGAKPYKWYDKDGVVHYGDTIPPEFSDRDRQQLNPNGVPFREFPRQLTPNEADSAQKKAEEEKRRHQHDDFLLKSYVMVSDIEQLRDERIALIDSQMELAGGLIAATNQRLTALQNRLGAFRPYAVATNARRVPDQLAEEVVRALSERRSLSTQLQQREKEKAEQRASFEADITRYKELTANSSRR